MKKLGTVKEVVTVKKLGTVKEVVTVKKLGTVKEVVTVKKLGTVKKVVTEEVGNSEEGDDSEEVGNNEESGDSEESGRFRPIRSWCEYSIELLIGQFRRHLQPPPPHTLHCRHFHCFTLHVPSSSFRPTSVGVKHMSQHADLMPSQGHLDDIQ